MRQKAIVSWSGGKDSALALYHARQEYDIVAMLTTVTEGYDRISVHGVRSCLLEQQANALGYPVEKVVIGQVCTNDEYETKMRAALEQHRQAGVSAVICGDIFLEDVRRYREAKLFTVGLKGVFPLWHRPSMELAREFLALGFQGILCCVDTLVLDGRFAGRLYDERLLGELPPSVDPCGENGEFHTFVFDGPNFKDPVPCTAGELLLRDNRFQYCDLLPWEQRGRI